MQGKHKGPSTELATPLVGSPHPPDPHLLRQARAEVRGTISSLKASYGIRVDMRGHNQTDAQDLTHLEKLTLVEAAASLRTVRQELAKYPQDFLTFCQIRRLRLVHTFYAHEPSLQQEVAYVGRTYHEDRTIYVAISGEGLYSLQATLHHELFHLSDSAQIQRDVRLNRYRVAHAELAPVIYQQLYDQEWETLNPQGEDAYAGPAALTGPGQANEPPPKGFALDYGTMDPWEDRATIAGLLLTVPQTALARAQRDHVFGVKLARIMTFYKQRSAGKMDASYFADLAAGKVTEGYWKPTSRSSSREGLPGSCRNTHDLELSGLEQGSSLAFAC